MASMKHEHTIKHSPFLGTNSADETRWFLVRSTLTLIANAVKTLGAVSSPVEYHTKWLLTAGTLVFINELLF